MRSFWDKCAAVARVVVTLLVVIAISGVAHLGVESAADTGVVDGDCGLGCADEGAPCPPVCPTCTCAHASRVSLPFPRLGLMLVAVADECSFVVPMALAPPMPEPRPIFHPPRA